MAGTLKVWVALTDRLVVTPKKKDFKILKEYLTPALNINHRNKLIYKKHCELWQNTISITYKCLAQRIQIPITNKDLLSSSAWKVTAPASVYAGPIRWPAIVVGSRGYSCCIPSAPLGSGSTALPATLELGSHLLFDLSTTFALSIENDSI